MAGYWETPLAQKLGLKTGMRLIVLGAPKNYEALLGKLPDEVEFSNQVREDSKFIHCFVTRRSDLEKQLPRLCRALASDGTVWISWPKKSARFPTDVTEDVIRSVALPLGLVDTKVCAIDDTWSGLKLMIRRENRARKIPPK